MKQVVYLTENDIRNMVMEAIDEVDGFRKTMTKSGYAPGGMMNSIRRFINPSKAYKYDHAKRRAEELHRQGLAGGRGGLDTYTGQNIAATTKAKSEAEFKQELANKTNKYGEKLYKTEADLNNAAAQAYNAQQQRIKQSNYYASKYENPTDGAYYETGLTQHHNAYDVVLHYIDADPQAFRRCLVSYLPLCSGNKNSYNTVNNIIMDLNSGDTGIAKVKDYIMKYRHNDAVSRMCMYVQSHCKPSTYARQQQRQ